MPTTDPKQPQKLTPPKTRLTQAWHMAWQRYYGVAPRKLFALQRHYIPAIRGLAHAHRVRK